VELVTIKVTAQTARNFKGAAYLNGVKQYEAAEYASEMYLYLAEKKKLRAKIKLKSSNKK
jgi:hypothetical protein